MKLLADHGADPKIPTKAGITPLMVAAGLDYWQGESPGPFTGVSEAERLEAVKLAVALGNDVNAHADFGNYPMTGDTSYTLLYYPLNIDDLLELGVGDPRWSGSTPMIGAVVSDQPTIVQWLVDHGARVDAKTKLGWTPLLVAEGVFFANAKKEFPQAAAILRKAIDRSGTDREPVRLHQFLFDQLWHHGVRHIFGIPGDFVLNLYEALEDDGRFRLVRLSHEPAVGFAADGAARMTGGLGVCCVTYGAGGLNMINSVACAYAEESPLVVLTGGPGRIERQADVPVHHEVKSFESQHKIYQEVTEYAAILDDPRTAAGHILTALETAIKVKRPVYLEIPRDMVTAEIDPPVDGERAHDVAWPTIRTSSKRPLARSSSASTPPNGR